MQSAKAKENEAKGGELDNIIGGPAGDAAGELRSVGEPDRERRRWPMSRASRAIVEATAAAFNLEREKWQRAQADRERRISEAMALDGLPELGDDFQGAMQDGEEWVEVLPADVARMRQGGSLKPD